MRVGRMYHRSLRLADGRVLVSSNEQAELFDPKTEAWTQLPDLPKGLFGYVLASLPDGSALLVGSATTGAGRAFVYDPAGNRWRRAAPPKVGRYSGHTLTPLGDGTVLLVGGAIGPSRASGGSVLTDVVERYDPKADAWRPA
ncbi:MAG TPA: kelch repeat-containing protein, partial [Polyangiaceae bacterium]|nr:kelch repeat-containing protein [Polyangiaceae bacterium]